MLIHNFILINATFNGQKQVSEVVNAALAANGVALKKGVVAGKAVVDQRKAIEKPKPETVIVISSDESGQETKHVSRKVSREGSSRKDGKAFSSVLTARSKVIFYSYW